MNYRSNQRFGLHLDENKQLLADVLANQADVHFRSIHIADRSAWIVYVTSVTNPQLILDELLKPLLIDVHRLPLIRKGKFNDELIQKLIPIGRIQKSVQVNQVIDQLFSGFVAILVEHEAEIMLVHLPREVSRSLVTPENEYVARGTNVGFVEDALLNIALIRKRVKSEKLFSKSFKVGKWSQADVYLLYIDGLANLELVEKISNRIASIVTDQIHDTAQIEEWIEDTHWSPFEQMQNSDRPEMCAAALIEGRVVMILDGCATALIAPVHFQQLFKSISDYSMRMITANLKRLFRFLAFVLSTNLSAIYVAFVGFHTHLIPIKLITILEAKRGMVPYPPFFEILLMQIILDLILEAILRLPSKLGQIIGVSGAIIVGQTAVTAQLISPAVIIVVSITTITGFANARLSIAYAFTWVRYLNLIAAALLGAIGLIWMWMFWLIHLCRLESFGQAYMQPISPIVFNSLRDSFIRIPAIRKKFLK